VLAENKFDYILGMKVNALTFKELGEEIVKRIRNNEFGYICVATVHMVIESWCDENFRNIVNSAFKVTPDGMPLYLYLKLKGFKESERLRGTDIIRYVCSICEKENLPVGFYGGTEKSLRRLVRKLKEECPGLRVNYVYSPPFRELHKEEKIKIRKNINNSGVKVLFVGIGCPKQERWMFENRDKIKAVMLGVGAAFGFIAGTKKEVPKILSRLSLEWLWRLFQEPKRLWKRYLIGNTIFLWLVLKEFIKIKILKKKLKKLL